MQTGSFQTFCRGRLPAYLFTGGTISISNASRSNTDSQVLSHHQDIPEGAALLRPIGNPGTGGKGSLHWL
ncbi:MAG: hypothetical protein METHSR3v1_800011 [Methanothrix sp.]|nr:MAG: hypothetical protein METHSR3v1_800011 [Methanothrix sp.]